MKIFVTTKKFRGRSEPYRIDVPVNYLIDVVTLSKMGWPEKEAKRVEMIRGRKKGDNKLPRYILPEETDFSKEEKKMVKYPAKTIAECKEVIRKWLHITDDAIIDVIFAFAISEKVLGDPIWLFLIAPPGGCKTEIIRAMNGRDYYHLSDLTSKTFVSGLMLGKGAERQKIEDLLPQLDGKILLLKDFTTILEKGKEERREVLAQLREIYDGMFSKKFGTIDKKIEYKARFGLIAGVTPIIDKHWKVMQQLGERFLKYRWSEDAESTTRRAEKNEGQEKTMREELHKAVMGFLTHVEISQIEISKEHTDKLIQAAQFLALLRTPVQIRTTQTAFYFDYIPTPEQPTRLVKQLKKLCKCLANIRCKKEITSAEVDTALLVAAHTAPPDRLAVLKAIKEAQEGIHYQGCKMVSIKAQVKLPESSIRNVIQQLELLDLIIITKVKTETGNVIDWDVFYRLSKKATALSPPTFFVRTKEVAEVSACHENIELLLGVIREKHPKGYCAEQFSKKYGEATMQKLLADGQIIEQPAGFLKTL